MGAMNTDVKAKYFKAISSSTTDICANQTNSGGGDMPLTTGTGVFTGGSESNKIAAAVNITSTAGDSNTGITFNVVGIGKDGVSTVSESGITGPAGSSTVTTGQVYTKVTQIVHSGTVTNVSCGFAASTSGLVFGGRTRIRGLHGVSSATAGELQFYNNSSASGTVLLSIDTPNQDDMLDPYIPDDGVIFDSNGCFASLGTGITSVTVFYDG